MTTGRSASDTEPIEARLVRDKQERLSGPFAKVFYHPTNQYQRSSQNPPHTFRNTFLGCLEGHGAPESTVKLIVGQKRGSLVRAFHLVGEFLGWFARLEAVIDQSIIDVLELEPTVGQLLMIYLNFSSKCTLLQEFALADGVGLSAKERKTFSNFSAALRSHRGTTDRANRHRFLQSTE